VPDYFPRNIITRSVGSRPGVQVDLEGIFPSAIGDTFLLCTDGLPGLVDDTEIGMILKHLPPSESVRALKDLAVLKGGFDNITAIVVHVTGPQAVGRPDSDSFASTPGADADTRPEGSFDGQRLGKGPYTATDCFSDDGFVARLADVLEKLHGTAAHANWETSQGELGTSRDRAAAAARAGDQTQAVREYCRAIRSALKRPDTCPEPMG
jgi:hypothetical protein